MRKNILQSRVEQSKVEHRLVLSTLQSRVEGIIEYIAKQSRVKVGKNILQSKAELSWVERVAE